MYPSVVVFKFRLWCTYWADHRCHFWNMHYIECYTSIKFCPCWW